MAAMVLMRGGGDLASGVALRLHRAGLKLLITELPQPLVVRRLVSFAEAVYRGQATVEGVTAHKVSDLDEALSISSRGDIPVLLDPECRTLQELRAASHPSRTTILVDARMTKRPPEVGLGAADFTIGLGPGFIAGENCHAAVETKRGHFMGRVIWDGSPEADTGIPEGVAGRQADRVLRAPVDGAVQAHAEICDRVEAGQLVAEVGGQPVLAPFSGVLRGLLHSGLVVRAGSKVGDLDPRADPRYCSLVSDKSLAVGGGVLEALLANPTLRERLWD